MHPYDAIPPLAGLTTPRRATRVGWSVEENVHRLLRLQWTAHRLARAMLAHLAAEPVWEVKCALALHQWQCAEHVDAMRRRVSEMRSPAPPLDVAPEDAAALDAFLDELLRARGTAELLAGIHGVALPALAAAYRAHVDGANPLVDQPTCRALRLALLETEEAAAWGAAALAAVTAADDTARRAAEAWRAHLGAYLAAAGGVAGDVPNEAGEPPPPRARGPFVPDFHPQRDERFHGRYNFEFAPHVVYGMPGVPADERNLALLCKRALEMDVPEMMASFLTERADLPWELQRAYARQLWDEARHAMMGAVALDARLAPRGLDWRRLVPLNVGFSLRLNLHAAPVERQTMLYAIEQSLMPTDTGKRFEHETAATAGDALSAHFHDYDWADEVLHARVGRAALRHDGIAPAEARGRAAEIHERTWAALRAYTHLDAQHDWWPAFVETVLGRPSAAVERPALDILHE